MNISAEYSLEKKENRRVEPCGHLSITDFIHGDIYRRNMSLDAIHLISLAQPQYGFEPQTFSLQGRCSSHLSYWGNILTRQMELDLKMCPLRIHMIVVSNRHIHLAISVLYHTCVNIASIILINFSHPPLLHLFNPSCLFIRTLFD